MTDNGIADRLRFIIEADRLKAVERITKLIGGERRESAAEHSWHVALMAIILHGYSNSPVELLRVLTMLVIHDLVEIRVGDAFLHGEEHDGRARREQERDAADKLFGLLPPQQGSALRQLWLEFDEGATTEARFAHAIDRFQPLLHNLLNEGGDWEEYAVDHAAVLAKNRHIREGSEQLWDHIVQMLDDAVQSGILRPSV